MSFEFHGVLPTVCSKGLALISLNIINSTIGVVYMVYEPKRRTDVKDIWSSQLKLMCELNIDLRSIPRKEAPVTCSPCFLRLRKDIRVAQYFCLYVNVAGRERVLSDPCWNRRVANMGPLSKFSSGECVEGCVVPQASLLSRAQST